MSESMARIRQTNLFYRIMKYRRGYRRGVAQVSHRYRKFIEQAFVHGLPLILRHLRYPCDTLATGGVSQLFVNNTNAYRSILTICDTSQLFFIFSATKKILDI